MRYQWFSYRHTKNVDLAADYLQYEVLALPYNSNKQQETYADMTNLPAGYGKEGAIVTPIGIYCSLWS